MYVLMQETFVKLFIITVNTYKIFRRLRIKITLSKFRDIMESFYFLLKRTGFLSGKYRLFFYSYLSPGYFGLHHFVCKGFFTCLGLKLRAHFSLGMSVHFSSGINFGTNFVSKWQIVLGFISHISMGTSTKEYTIFSWHSSGPSSTLHPAPHISIGICSQVVLPIHLACLC